MKRTGNQNSIIEINTTKFEKNETLKANWIQSEFLGGHCFKYKNLVKPETILQENNNATG